MSGINTIGDKETDLLEGRKLFFTRKNEGGKTYFMNISVIFSLLRVNDHVSEYEEM